MLDEEGRLLAVYEAGPTDGRLRGQRGAVGRAVARPEPGGAKTGLGCAAAWTSSAPTQHAAAAPRHRLSPSAPTTASTSGTDGPSALPSSGRAPRARELVVVTFDRHPAEVVRPESAPTLLTDLDQRLELLASMRASTHAWSCPSTRPPRPESGRGLHRRGPGRGTRLRRWWWWGRTSTSAQTAAGNVALLRQVGARRGFAVEGLELGTDGRRARLALRGSERSWRQATWPPPPSCSAASTRSAARWSTATAVGGAELGFPTANLDLDQRHGPARQTGSTPGGTAPDGVECTPRRDLGGAAARPSSRAPSRWSRRSCSTSPATSTARGQGVVRGPAARRGALRLGRGSRSPRCTATWPRPPPSWQPPPSRRRPRAPGHLAPAARHRRRRLLA